MHRQRERGFTLVELMVVIVLIGLLAGVVGTQIVPLLIKGKETTARTQMKALADALTTYRINNGRYPDTLQTLLEPDDAWENGYIEGGEIPLDPWGEEYVYVNEGKTFVLLSKGEDLMEGTEDDITPKEEKDE